MLLRRLVPVLRQVPAASAASVWGRPASTGAPLIQQRLEEDVIPSTIKSVIDFRKEHDDTVIDSVTVKQVFGGMRGIKSMLCETSELDPEAGIRFRGLSIPETLAALAHNGRDATPEGLFWLLATGAAPSADEADSITEEWKRFSKVPDHVREMIVNFPKHLHPMAQFSAAIAALSTESAFAKAYAGGAPKSELWKATLEDSSRLLGPLPGVAALIYRSTFHDDNTVVEYNEDWDWTQNFCHMLGYDDPEFTKLMRLYFIIHSDHEGGNVSAHTCHLVGSALSDPFLSVSASMCGLAGPLHGRANQEVLQFLSRMSESVGDNPTADEVRQYVWDTLNSGQVVPGFGHAVLRVTDPRFVAQQQFAEDHKLSYPLINLVHQLYDIVPGVLKEHGKAANPWPNVDAHSGALLHYFGLTEMEYYTVLFGISRAIGVLTSLVWDRIYGLPLERPKSLTTAGLKRRAEEASS